MNFKTDEATQKDILEYLSIHFPNHNFRIDITRSKISIATTEYTLHYTLQNNGSIKDSVEFWSFTYSADEIFMAARNAEKVHDTVRNNIVRWLLQYNADLILNQ